MQLCRSVVGLALLPITTLAGKKFQACMQMIIYWGICQPSISGLLVCCQLNASSIFFKCILIFSFVVASDVSSIVIVASLLLGGLCFSISLRHHHREGHW